MAAGDFNGDGQPELACLYVNADGGLTLYVHNIDPKTLIPTLASSLNLTTPGATANNPLGKVSMARGRFNSGGHDHLAVAFATNSGLAYVEIIDFDLNSLNPKEPSPFPPFLRTRGLFRADTLK